MARQASRAFQAGCDIALHCSGFLKDPDAILAEMQEVADASPVLTGESLRRARAAEAATRHGKDFDKAEGREKLQKLLSRVSPSGTAAA